METRSLQKESGHHDKERFARAQGLIAEEPRLALAGPTNGWVAAAAETTEGFLQPSALAHVRIPVGVATASQEQLVDSASHERVAAQFADVKHITVEGAKHEMLQELDPLRARVWALFDDIADRAAPKA